MSFDAFDEERTFERIKKKGNGGWGGESGGKEKNKSKKKREIKVRDLEGLTATLESEASEIKKEEPVQDEAPEPEAVPVSGEKKIIEKEIRSDRKKEYLANQLVKDLKVLYPQVGAQSSEEEWQGMNKRLRENGVRWLVGPNTKVGMEGKVIRRFRDGQKMIGGLEKFLIMENGTPEDWEETKKLLQESGISEENLGEARKNLKNKKELVVDIEQESDGPLDKLEDLATNKKAFTDLALVYRGLKTDLERERADLLLRAALDCLNNKDLRKNSGNEWKDRYLPTLINLGIKID